LKDVVRNAHAGAPREPFEQLLVQPAGSRLPRPPGAFVLRALRLAARRSWPNGGKARQGKVRRLQ
jgi:hypothetical protein